MTSLQPRAARMDIVWQAGSDDPAVIPVLDEEGQPRDVSGWSARAVVTHRGLVVHTWTTEDGSAECGPDGVTLLADRSSDWSWARGEYDVLVTDPQGEVREVPAYGVMRVRPLRSST